MVRHSPDLDSDGEALVLDPLVDSLVDLLVDLLVDQDSRGILL